MPGSHAAPQSAATTVVVTPQPPRSPAPGPLASVPAMSHTFSPDVTLGSKALVHPRVSATPMLANAAPPDAPPRIVAMNFPKVVHGGQTLVASVTTTTNVASCELRVFGNVIPLQRPHVGAFVLHYGIPPLPGVFDRTYDVEVTAHNAAGRTAVEHVLLRLE